MKQFYKLSKDDKEFIKHFKRNAGRILDIKYITSKRTIKPKYLRMTYILDEYRRS